MTKRRSRISLLSLALVALVVFFVVHNPRQSYFTEKTAFRVLSTEANHYIEGGGPGVAMADGKRFIQSPRLFFDYLRQRNPAMVSAFDADNPIPGILPKGQYRWGVESASQSTDLLLYSLQKYEGDKVQMAIACDGTFREEKDRNNGVSYRKAD